MILQFIEATRTDGRSLLPKSPLLLQQELRALGLALAACEKSVQLVYERNLRPAEAQYEPWIERVTGQLLAAYAGLEQEVKAKALDFVQTPGQAVITAAVTWQFTQSMLAHVVPAAHYPGLSALSARMEETPAFMKYPPAGPGVPASGG